MSSPFLHLRELLKELDFRDTPLNLAADLCEHLKKYLGTRHELQFCSNSFKMSQDACWECAMAHVRINSEEAANLEEF
ncbi:hypothetical protein Ahy_A07g035089 isoform D [Arachis hypogaea]|uniref:Uncharacterized protein n=1 Tax=Arachis hypogaea TaxID=3818 RepID=A0A445CDB7_ARAHY|nr:hypothetical protein Ahy_A07g035089 isoform D [Arachis hypogaea]